ncbi:hypothetical protein AAZX31_14G118700 [Glycine max]
MQEKVSTLIVKMRRCYKEALIPTSTQFRRESVYVTKIPRIEKEKRIRFLRKKMRLLFYLLRVKLILMNVKKKKSTNTKTHLNMLKTPPPPPPPLSLSLYI